MEWRQGREWRRSIEVNVHVYNCPKGIISTVCGTNAVPVVTSWYSSLASGPMPSGNGSRGRWGIPGDSVPAPDCGVGERSKPIVIAN